MRRSRTSLVFAACLSLLCLQLSGVHIHADDGGYIGAPETPFTHSHGRLDHGDAHHAGGDTLGHVDHDFGSPHDYEGAEDVSLLELALGTFKMPLAILALFLLFLVLSRIRSLCASEFVYRVLSGRHTRWRPPLRAPPQPAQT